MNEPPVKFLRASRLPKKELAKGRQQVAAVCYRVGKRSIEFLLVQTRGGRWIFPKGGVESGLTQAQSAALEAIEEAGVHGRMEELPFARYFRCRRDSVPSSDRSSDRSCEPELAVAAHLCEVTRLEPPQEAGRNPTWFSAERAKQRLEKGRPPEFGAELARVIDRALARIQRLHASERAIPDRIRRDGLQEVRFEAFECGRFPGDLREAVLARYLLRPPNARLSGSIKAGAQGHLQKTAIPGEIRRPVLRLSAGAGSPADVADNITAIDGGRRAIPSKPGKPPASRRNVLGRVVGGRKQSVRLGKS
jgi:8-oxo-dGTP pyrophosphatase MutT (NUDIX family)